MPLYEYECRACGHLTEKLVSMSQEKYVCDVCGKTADRVISSTTFRLKGGGWEKDGYQKPSGDKR